MWDRVLTKVAQHKNLRGFRPIRFYEAHYPETVKAFVSTKGVRWNRVGAQWEPYTRRSAFLLKELGADMFNVELTNDLDEREYIEVPTEDFDFNECCECHLDFRREPEALNLDGLCAECVEKLAQGEKCENDSCEGPAQYVLQLGEKTFKICEACRQMFQEGYDSAKKGLRANILKIPVEGEEGPGDQSRPPETSGGPPLI
jgi:hypothetical protein